MSTHTHPAGSTVRYHNPANASHHGKEFTILDPALSSDSSIRRDERRYEREFVLDALGQCWWLEAGNLILVTPTPATEYPVGATVRDVKYNLLGTVVSHSPSHDGPVVEFPEHGATIKHQAGFPDPVGRLERVHILTHEELVELDEVRRMSAPGDLGFDILDRHLRPTVTQTFTVTVEQPADAPKPVDPWYIEHMLTTGDQTGLRVTIEEQTR